MLGEKLGTESGHVTGRRILPADDFRYMKMEVSFESTVDILGVQGQNLGTYVAFERGPGQLYAEGQGVVMTADGDGAIWNGHGVLRMAPDGGIAVSASIAFQTTSEKLKRLNEVLVLVEHHTHADGHLHSDLWAWTTADH
jgi:hypothetical protein